MPIPIARISVRTLARSAKLALVAASSAIACSWFDTSEKPAPTPVPVDRLKSDEPGSSEAQYLGFNVPPGMRLDARFPKEVQLVGRTPQKAVLDHIRKQVVASHVVLEGDQLILPQTALKRGSPSRVFRVTISRALGQTRVVIRDTTPSVTQQGLSEAERLKQAGLGPDGKQLDLGSQR